MELLLLLFETSENKLVSVVVDKLGERSLPTPEVRDSNPVMGKIMYTELLFVNWWKYKNKGKNSPGMAH